MIRQVPVVRGSTPLVSSGCSYSINCNESVSSLTCWKNRVKSQNREEEKTRNQKEESY